MSSADNNIYITPRLNFHISYIPITFPIPVTPYIAQPHKYERNSEHQNRKKQETGRKPIMKELKWKY